MIAAPVAALAALAALIGVAAGLRWIPYHPSAKAYPVRGLDVSHHQGPIDWEQVATGAARFAFIKATEGGDWVDPLFARNWSDSQAAGVPRGAYHFFTLCRPGSDQAAHLIATVPRETGMLPVAVDLEFGGNCSEGPDRLDVDRELSVFLDIVEPHYGRAAVLYATPEFYERHLAGDGRDNPLWLRAIILPPRYNERDWTLWQYSGFGRSPGVRGPVDWNAFDGTPTEFDAWRSAPTSR